MAINLKTQNQKRARRAARVRKQIRGTEARPRLTVFRSNRFLYVQLINDTTQKTLVAATTREDAKTKGGKKIDKATALGKEIAEKAKKIGIESVVFDKGAAAYHGRVKAIAESARAAGLKF